MYKAIKYFVDLQDNRHPYNAGDTFPRDGLEVSKERIIELSTAINKRNEPLITFIQDEVEQVPIIFEEPDKQEVSKEPEETSPKKPASNSKKTSSK